MVFTEEFKMQVDQVGIESGLFPDQAMKQTSAVLKLLENLASQPTAPPDPAEDAAGKEKNELDDIFWQFFKVHSLICMKLPSDPMLTRTMARQLFQRGVEIGKKVLKHSAKQ